MFQGIYVYTMQSSNKKKAEEFEDGKKYGKSKNM